MALWGWVMGARAGGGGRVVGRGLVGALGGGVDGDLL